MTNRFWHLANPDGTGTGNVVRPKWDKPVRNKFSQSEAEMQMWEEELQQHISEWNDHVSSLPVTHHCDPSNPVGWIEGEEEYQVTLSESESFWVCAEKEVYDIWVITEPEEYRRIWIGPKRDQPQPVQAKPFYTDTVREMLNQYETEQISIGKLTELLNQAAEKFYKS